jgi:hypothetical protein
MVGSHKFTYFIFGSPKISILPVLQSTAQEANREARERSLEEIRKLVRELVLKM